MKNIIYFSFLLASLCATQVARAQIGMGTETPQGALDITSSDKGFLVPRMALTSRNLAAPVINPQGGAPADGTLIYNTATAGTAPDNVAPGFYYWKNGEWTPVSGDAELTFPYYAYASGNGFLLSTTGSNAIGVAAHASSATGTGSGVKGSTDALAGYGVVGIAQDGAQNGTGVFGAATATAGATLGVHGLVNSANGIGGYFTNTANGSALATDEGTVTFGDLAGPGNRMVVAAPDGTLSTQPIESFTLPYSGTTSDNNGIYIQANGAGPSTAIKGVSNGTTGPSVGVVGIGNMPGMHGMQAVSTATTGTGVGIIGYSFSPDGTAAKLYGAVDGHALHTVNGDVRIEDLSGTGTRMVVAGADGTLSTQATPEGLVLPYSGTTAAGSALSVTSTAVDGIGLSGISSVSTGVGVGVYGGTSSATGSGVRGVSNAGSGSGVNGISFSPNGIGGRFENTEGGIALATSGGTVQFSDLSGTGTRMVVAGADGTLSTQASGLTLPYNATTTGDGITIQSSTTNGAAITGWATNETGSGVGIRGTSTATNGTGVIGSSEDANGVYGETYGNTGRGVVGRANSAGGANYGVYGSSVSNQGAGGYFENTGSGNALQTGTGAVKMAALGGTGSRMVIAGADGTLSTQAIASVTLPFTGISATDAITVSATGGFQNGIVGNSTSTTGYGAGVFGTSSGDNGIGVRGHANAASGETYGVFGRAQSAGGYGGYFSNISSDGGDALRTGTGTVQFDNLAGTGSRMVVAGADGTLSTQSLSTGTLDAAYDFGGFGSGREINATDGPLYVSGTDGIMVSGVWGEGDPITFPTLGNATFMFFSPKKGAFRSGLLVSTEWYDANLGNFSAAFGVGVIANASYSFASGYGSSSLGNAAVAMGDNAYANGPACVALGYYPQAYGNESVALGAYSRAKSFREISIGSSPSEYSPASTTAWVGSDRLFSIGNGTNSTPSNAMTVLKNGNIGFGSGNETPSATVDVSGTLRIRGNGAGAGKVLTSDANGNATWQSVSGGGGDGGQWTEDGNNLLYTAGSVTVASNAPGNSFVAGTTPSSGPGAAAIYGITSDFNCTAIKGEDFNSGPSSSAGIYGLSQYNLGVSGFSMYGTGGAFSTTFGTKALITGNGNVGIGNPNPTAKLDVIGSVKINDGTQAAGRVLTCDADGLASWQPAGGGGGATGWTVLGDNVYQTNIYNGTIGIGTNNPSPNTKLSVYGSEGSKPNGLYVNAATNNDYALRTTFGKVGIGTNTSTTEKLEVNGAIKIGAATEAATDGTLRYTPANGFEGKHGGNWQALGGGSAMATYAFQKSVNLGFGLTEGFNTLTFDGEAYDLGATGGNTFTAPTSGIYEFRSSVDLTPNISGEAGISVIFTRDGATFVGSTKRHEAHFISSTQTLEDTVSLYLNAGEQVGMSIFLTTYTPGLNLSCTGSGVSTFSGRKIQ